MDKILQPERTGRKASGLRFRRNYAGAAADILFPPKMKGEQNNGKKNYQQEDHCDLADPGHTE